MKKIKILIVSSLVALGFSGCQKIIDQDPVSNVAVNQFYRNYDEVKTALSGCYNGLQEPLATEWMLTELRSDISKQSSPTSATTSNIELNELNMYLENATHDKVYDYWISTYRNVRSVNYVLKSLGASYENGAINLGAGTASVSDTQRKQLAGEALFLRAYHYFNLVRLYGGVFLLTEPVDADAAKMINRSSVEDNYKLIIADLQAAASYLPRTKYGAAPADDLGRVTTWAAEALLAKVYLTLHRKADALTLLDDVIANSGHGLETSYANIFSTINEMNKEVLFAVRYKAGGLGLGSPMANTFAPTSSGSAVINGDGSGLNYPTTSLNSAYRTPTTGFADQRKAVTIGTYSTKLYVKKFLSPVLVKFDAENDFPVIRYSDVLLMKAEAIGFDGAAGVSVGLINQIRQRSGAGTYTTGNFDAGFFLYPAAGTGSIATSDAFLTALLNERRLEFAFENQRFFDLQRNDVLISTVQKYFSDEYSTHYRRYQPTITLADLQAKVTQNKTLLPIPQREIDTNDKIVIPQNADY